MNQPDNPQKPPFDVFVIGGGINGCGIARDAAGRGLTVGLAEMNDLASATSQASTKLFHGGLRYLEYFEFRLVREALKEREVLLRAMPHIAWPLRFVLPTHDAMRFEAQTPASRLLSRVLPWMRGRRPAWLIRLGLFLYDHLGGREILPATRTLDLAKDPSGAALKPRFKRAFEYSDCWVDDARLVVLNARDAARRGAQIMPRTKVVGAERSGALWHITLEHAGLRRVVQARALVNAAGPWVADVIQTVAQPGGSEGVRLVRGSHIITRKLFEHDKAYLLQGADGRVIFALPYEEDFTLIGTTEEDHPNPSEPPVCTPKEEAYLLDFASEFFAIPVTKEDIVHRFSGVRPLHDDGATAASAATRDYVLSLDTTQGAPLLNIFGGKITTYRKLAEAALARLTPLVGGHPEGWTAHAPLPGGEFPVAEAPALPDRLITDYPFLTPAWARRLARAYGVEAWSILGTARSADDLGEAFGATLTAAELDWAIRHEWVTQADDFLWRRSKLGLRMTAAQTTRVAAHIAAQTRLAQAS